jgi:hypothetical protein
MIWGLGKYTVLAIYLYGLWLYANGDGWAIAALLFAPVWAVFLVTYADFTSDSIVRSLGWLSSFLVLASAVAALILALVTGGVVTLIVSALLMFFGALVAIGAAFFLGWAWQPHLRSSAPDVPAIYAGFAS